MNPLFSVAIHAAVAAAMVSGPVTTPPSTHTAGGPSAAAMASPLPQPARTNNPSPSGTSSSHRAATSPSSSLPTSTQLTPPPSSEAATISPITPADRAIEMSQRLDEQKRLLEDITKSVLVVEKNTEKKFFQDLATDYAKDILFKLLPHPREKHDAPAPIVPLTITITGPLLAIARGIAWNQKAKHVFNSLLATYGVLLFVPFAAITLGLWRHSVHGEASPGRPPVIVGSSEQMTTVSILRAEAAESSAARQQLLASATTFAPQVERIVKTHVDHLGGGFGRFLLGLVLLINTFGVALIAWKVGVLR
jgi:hypothetical protein